MFIGVKNQQSKSCPSCMLYNYCGQMDGLRRTTDYGQQVITIAHPESSAQVR